MILFQLCKRAILWYKNRKQDEVIETINKSHTKEPSEKRESSFGFLDMLDQVNGIRPSSSISQDDTYIPSWATAGIGNHDRHHARLMKDLWSDRLPSAGEDTLKSMSDVDDHGYVPSWIQKAEQADDNAYERDRDTVEVVKDISQAGSLPSLSNRGKAELLDAELNEKSELELNKDERFEKEFIGNFENMKELSLSSFGDNQEKEEFAPSWGHIKTLKCKKSNVDSIKDDLSIEDVPSKVEVNRELVSQNTNASWVLKNSTTITK